MRFSGSDRITRDGIVTSYLAAIKTAAAEVGVQVGRLSDIEQASGFRRSQTNIAEARRR
jgi:hypothetical protein